MVDHLKIDAVTLDSVLDDAISAKNAFGSENARFENVTGAVGEHQLAEALGKFASDWSLRREKLEGSIDTLVEDIRGTKETFEQLDREFAEKFYGAGGKPHPQPATSAGRPWPPAVPGAGWGVPTPAVAESDRSEAAGQPPPTLASPETVPDGAEPTVSGHTPVASDGIPEVVSPGGSPVMDHVLRRLTSAVRGWEELPTNEQALLFTSIGVAGLTLLVRAGRLSESVVETAVRGMPPGIGRPDGATFPDPGIPIHTHEASDAPQSVPIETAVEPHPVTDLGSAYGSPTDVDVPVEPSDAEPEPLISETSPRSVGETLDPAVESAPSSDATPTHGGSTPSAGEPLPQVPDLEPLDRSFPADGGSVTGPALAVRGIAAALGDPGSAPWRPDTTPLPSLGEALGQADTGTHAATTPTPLSVAASHTVPPISSSLGSGAGAASGSPATKSTEHEGRVREAAEALESLRNHKEGSK